MKALVSILIPAYNAQRWIAEALRSALAQTWSNKEIIVINDGSSDQTLTIARRFECSYLKVVSQENRGASAARNTALGLSQGNYIQWLDADDLLAPDKIQKQVEAAATISPATLLSSSWGYFYHRTENAKFKRTDLWEDLKPVEWLFRKMEQNLHMANFSWLVSRKLTDAAGLWDTHLSLDDDGEYFCRVLFHSEGVRFVEQARGFYRRSSALSQSQMSEEKLESQLFSVRSHVQHLMLLENSDRARRTCLIFLQRWLAHFYPIRADCVRELREMARDLGGELALPTISWKYSWIQKLFGWTAVKRISKRWNHAKIVVTELVDLALSKILRQHATAKKTTSEDAIAERR